MIVTGIEDYNGKDAYKLMVTSPLNSIHAYYYDINTGYKIGEAYTYPGSSSTTTTEYSDFSENSGIIFPFKTYIDNSYSDYNLSVQKIKVNGE